MKSMMVAGVALAAALAASAPASAATQSKAPMNAAQVRDYVASVSIWAQNFHAVLTGEAELLGALNQGAGQALDFNARHDVKAAQAWAEPWAAARRAELQNLKQRADSLSLDPPAAPAGNLDPTLPAMLAGLHNTAVKTQASARTAIALGEDMIALSEAAASGDAAAAAKLALRRIDANQVMLQGEITVVETAATSLRADHPERDLGKSTIADDSALISLLDYQKARLGGQMVDPAPYAERVRQQERTITNLVIRVRADAASALAAMRATPGVAGTELFERTERAVRTYDQSAEVEARVAASLEKIAARIAAGDTMDSAAMQAALAEHSGAVRERVQIDQDRNHIISGQQ